MAGLTAIKRKGFKGGGMDASTSSFDKGATSKGPNPSREDRVSHGATQFQADNQGFTPTQVANQNASTPSKAVIDKQKYLYEKQFGGVSPIGSRPIGFFDRINKYNTNFQKKQNIKLAQKRAFELAKRLEKYVHGDMDMDYDFTQDIYGNTIDKGLENLISNKGTSIESSRPNLYTVNPSTNYSMLQALLSKTRPDTQVTLENTKNLMRDYNLLSMDPNISKAKLDALANRGKTPDQINPPTGGEGNNQSYLPYPYPFPGENNVENEVEEDEFEYRFGNEQKVGADVTRGFYNQGGRIPRAFGGIMDTTTGRKAYGLGSIFKKVTKAAKKVLSSDIGKAAIAGAAFYYGGGGGNPFTAAGRSKFSLTGPGSFFSKSNPLLFSANEAGKQVFNPLKMAGLITLGGALAGPAKQDSLEGFNNRGGRLIDPITGKEAVPAEMRASLNEALDDADGDPDKIKAITNAYAFLGPDQRLGTYLPYETYGVKDGGLIRSRFSLGGSGGQPLPADPTKPINPFAPKPIGPVLPNRAGGYGRQRVMAEEGGLMNLGGMEKDYRNEGGFVPIGREEKADDVPARLSVNEFVFTADAVRNAGGGDIDKGAEVMENMMKNLENGGRVSEESQGNTGAQEMFSVSERIGEVI